MHPIFQGWSDEVNTTRFRIWICYAWFVLCGCCSFRITWICGCLTHGNTVPLQCESLGCQRVSQHQVVYVYPVHPRLWVPEPETEQPTLHVHLRGGEAREKNWTGWFCVVCFLVRCFNQSRESLFISIQHNITHNMTTVRLNQWTEL